SGWHAINSGTGLAKTSVPYSPTEVGGYGYSFKVRGTFPSSALPGDTATIKVNLFVGGGSGCQPNTCTPQFLDLIAAPNDVEVTPTLTGPGCCWDFTLDAGCPPPALPANNIDKVIATVSGGRVQSATSPSGVNPAVWTLNTVTWADASGTGLTFPLSLNICFECANAAGMTVTFKGYASSGALLAELSQTVSLNDPVCKDMTPPTIHVCPGPLTGFGPGAVIPDVISLFTATSVTDNCSLFPALHITQLPVANTPASLGPPPFFNPMTHTITVTATDAAGNSATCPVIFTVRLPAVSAVADPEGHVVIAWPGPGHDPVIQWYRLQQAESPDGPWTTLDVTSPYTVTPIGAQKFYRLVLPSP